MDLKIPVVEKREEEEDLRHLTAEICKTLSFPAVLPPTAAELKCRESLGEVGVLAL